ncbi:MAG: hypothetical protein JNL05_10465 [Flavobacteriales bacterium]|nr:hypothetical protein [Flavobacteriales bacterium]
MATALYLCPCCNKLVPATHFRRAPWTEQDLSELLTHPRLLKVIEAKVRELVDAAAVEKARELVHEAVTEKHASFMRQVRQAKHDLRVVPPGYITYEDASERYKDRGITYQNIRSLVYQRRVIGGQGLVHEASLQGLLLTYKPRARARRA